MVVIQYTDDKNRKNSYKSPRVSKQNLPMKKRKNKNHRKKKPYTSGSRGMFYMRTSAIWNIYQSKDRSIQTHNSDKYP